MKNILVVSVNWLGDVIFSTPVYRALKDNYPGAKVSVLAVPRVKDALELCPDIDEVIIYDEDGADRPWADKIRLSVRLAKRHFDAVFFLRPSFSRALLTCMSGIPLRVGFRTKNFFRLINRQVDDSAHDAMHRSDVYLSLLERFGLKINDRVCRLRAPEESIELMGRILQAKGLKPGEPFCVLNTGGNWGLKQWPADRFAALTRKIMQDKKIRVVLPGADQDVERVARVASMSGTDPLQMAGNTNLSALAALFVLSKFVVSADSGPLHLASALGVRTVALFGPTSPSITGPRGWGKADVIFKDVRCNKAPCYHLECADNRCMKAVEVEDVIKVI